MDPAAELAEYLTSRRGNITPERAGLPSYGQRRVPGLRREEVASLAGVSVDYYKRLERGNASGVSDAVLDALATALRLDDAERSHLFDLARAANPGAPSRPRRVAPKVRPVAETILASITAPAIVSNDRGDYLAANALGRALYAPLFESAQQPTNSARFLFLDPAAQEFYVEWERVAKELVANLRSAAGRNPYDRALTDLVGELSTRSEPFRTWWAAHDVRHHQTGTKRIHHPIVGELQLTYEVLRFDADDLRLAVYTTEVGSRSAEGMQLLGSWVASGMEPANAAQPHGVPPQGSGRTESADGA